MKRACATISAMWTHWPKPIWILLAAALLLLPLLAFFQYRWIAQISEAERNRMQAVVRSAAAQFAESFDAEITRAYSTFQGAGAEEIDRLAPDYARRLAQWETEAPFPEMIRGLFAMTSDGRLLKFQRSEARLQEVEWPDELAPLRLLPNPGALDYIHEEIPALVLPPENPAANAWTIVQMDLEVIQAAILPALTHRFLMTTGELDYGLAVIAQAEGRKIIFESEPGLADVSVPADATVGLFDLRLEAIAKRFPINRPIMRVVKRQFINVGGTETSGRWQLLVRQRAGTLEQAVAASRHRNLAISFGVLLLLGFTIGLAVVATARASRLARDQMNFVATVSHELRTPLAVIRSAGENLADGIIPSTPQVAEYGTVIRDEGRRLSQMVEQVLEYAGRPAYRREPGDVREMIEAALRDCRQQIAGFEVETQIAPELPPLNVDRAALQRALENLIGNAVKYSAGDHWLAIRAQRQGEEIQITVEDRGRGIAPADLPHIFEPFRRGEDVIEAQIPGSGLGLSLVKQIVSAHGGRVSVRSAPERGSAFTIHLPA